MKILFVWYLITGVIMPQDNVDGRKTYTIKTNKGIIEHAYKAEVLEYLETGTFEYNEDLKD